MISLYLFRSDLNFPEGKHLWYRQYIASECLYFSLSLCVCVSLFLVCVFVCANPFMLLNLLSKTVWTIWKQKDRKSESKRMNNRTCEEDEARAIENAATLATNLIRLVSYRSFVVSSSVFFSISTFSAAFLYIFIFLIHCWYSFSGRLQ